MKTEMPITWFDVIDSTNSEAKRRISGIDKMAVIAAKFQTAGRGQRGNRWSSADGENLTFSIALKFGEETGELLKASSQFALSELAALSVHSYLSGLGIEARIKWPNDIYVRNRKICGMLIENALDGEYISSSIIGIGLNLKQKEFPPELMNPTSVSIVTGQDIEPANALADFIPHFTGRLGLLFSRDGRERLQADYLSALYRKDQEHQFRDCSTGEVFNGTIKGISTGGLLSVKMPDGSVKEFSFKEISYIL
ncbi:MAG: biotin--[acetyl-CoA-carboxylase] ligase [Candidatus Cryptobacteroides sp.]